MVTIYGLVCPVTREIRYIGKTRISANKRLVAHLQDAKKHHSHKQRWLAGCLTKGLKPSIWILEQVPPDVSWQDRERAWIRRALEMGFDLTNQTAGGEGLDFLDPDRKRQYSALISGQAKRRFEENPEFRQRLIEGTKKSWAENRQARLAAQESTRTPEALHKLAASMAEVRSRPGFKEERASQMRKRWESGRNAFLEAWAKPETKQKRAASAVAGWADPEKRKNKLSGRWTPEARAKQAAEIASRREKMGIAPESRKKQGAKMKEVWARRKAAGFTKLGGG